MRGSLAVLLLGLVVGFLGPTAVFAEETEKRLAFVVGNGDYPGAKLSTAANDAGLIAQTLQAAGFDVMGARDLEYDVLRQSYREFLQKAAEAGPDAVVFVYLSGYGLQYEGENYFAPIGARIAAASDVPIEALRFSDLTKPLAAVPLKARIFVFDAARENPFAKSGPPLAGGLALADPDPGALIAFNATPGTVAPGQTEGAYGAYAQALAEMMREGGLPIDAVFDRVRLRVNEVTKGGQVAWDASKITAPFTFFERAADAPPVAAPGPEAAFLREKPIRDFPAQEAYAAALERDTVQGYEAFLAAYPDDPMARRVRALLAARREAITWRQTALADSPDAYWSYLRRYPRGPHVPDARRRLAHFSAALEPPPSFEMMSYDIAPPPPAEIVYVDRPVLVFSDPFYDFAPPPPPPVFFLPPPTIIVIAPPPWPVQPFLLPVPVFVPLPVYVNPPRYVAAPSNDFYFRNRHLPPAAGPIGNGPAPRPGIPAGPGPVATPPFVGLPAAVRERGGGRGPFGPGVGTGGGAVPGQGPHGRAPGVDRNLPGSSGTVNAPIGGTPVLRDGVGGSKEQGLKELPKNDALSNGVRRGHQLPAVDGRALPGTTGARPGSSGAPDVRSGGAAAIPKEGLIGSQEQGHRRGSDARRGQPPSGARGQALPGASGQPAPEAIGNPPDASGAQRARGAGAGRRDGVASPQGHGVRQGPSSGAGGGQPHAGPRLQETAPRQGQIHQQPLNATQQRQQLMEQQQRQIQAPPQQHMQQRQHQAPPQQQMQQRQFQAPQQQHMPQRQYQAPQQQQMQQRQYQAPQQQQMQQRQFQAPQQQHMQQRQFQAPQQQQIQQRQFQAPQQQQMQQRQIQAPQQQQQRRVQPIPGQPQ